MRLRLVAWVALALILEGPLGLAAPESAWNQSHGDAQRAGLAPVRAEPLDVLAIHDLLPANHSLKGLVGPNLLETPDGLIGIARNDRSPNGDCLLLRIPLPFTGESSLQPLSDCHFGYFQGYDAATDTFFLCSMSRGDEPFFQARDASSGSVRWSLRRSQLGNTLEEPETRWSCSGVAFDFARGIAIVPVGSSRSGADFPRNRVVRLDVRTGAPVWVRQVVVPTGSVPAIPSTDQTDRDGAGPNFLPLSATLTTDGVVVMGVTICADTLTCDPPQGAVNEYEDPFPVESAVAWFDLAGNRRGVLVAKDDAGANTRRSCVDPARAPIERIRSGSTAATASGNEAILHLGQCLYKLRATEPEPVGKTAIASLEQRDPGELGYAPGAWTPDGVIVPSRKSIAAFHPVDLSPLWSWTLQDPGRDPEAVVGSRDGTAWVLATSAAQRVPAEDPQAAVLYRLDTTRAAEDKSARLQQKLYLPLRVFRTYEEGVALTGEPVRAGSTTVQYISFFNRGPDITPLASGDLVLTDMAGRLVYLGVCSEVARPSISISDTFPRPGIATRLTIEAPPGAGGNYTIIWGDGEAQSLSAAAGRKIAASHVFNAPGTHTVVVTAHYADGTTGTAEALVEVGGAPPALLTPLQRAFAPQNQEWTFFFLGLAITFLGALFTILRRRHRRSRIERELRRLDQIRDEASKDIAASLKSLDFFRESLRDKLARGRLDDAQFGAIQLAALQLQRALRHRLFAPFEGRMSPSFQRHLDAALEDGVVNHQEAERLLDQLGRERRLATAEKRRLGALIRV